jgi:hypothetical protein
LVLANGGGLVIFRAGAEAVLGDTLHLIEEVVAQFKQPLLLAVEELEGLGVTRQADLRAHDFMILGVAIGNGLGLDFGFGCF